MVNEEERTSAITSRQLAIIEDTAKGLAALASKVDGIAVNVNDLPTTIREMGTRLDVIREAGRLPLGTLFTGAGFMLALVSALGWLAIGAPQARIIKDVDRNTTLLYQHMVDGHPKRIEEAIRRIEKDIEHARPDPYKGSDAQRDFQAMREWMDLKIKSELKGASPE